MNLNMHIYEVFLLLVFMWRICLCSKATTAEVAVNLQHGIIFENEGQMVLTGPEFNIVLDFNISALQLEYTNLEHSMGYLNKSIQQSNYTRLLFESALNLVSHNLKLYKEELNDLFDILLKQRAKKGLFNIVGAGLNSLFGTLDQGTLQDIDVRMSSLEESIGDAKNAIGNVVMLQRGWEDKVSLSMHMLKNVTFQLIEKLRNSDKGVLREMKSVNMQLSVVQSEISQASSLHDLSFLLQSCRAELASFRNAIELSANHRLSSFLLHPNRFMRMLRQIRDNLKEPSRMIMPCTLEFLHLYYEVAKVAIYARGQSLIILISVPLANEKHTFEKYKIIKFPVYWPQIKQSVMWKLADYIYITADRSNYFLLNDELECKGNNIKFCRHQQIVYDRSQPSCELNMFLSSATPLCEKEVVFSNIPFIWRSKDDFVYSVLGTSKVTVMCRESGNKDVTKTMIVTGSGVIRGVSRCSITGDGFRSAATAHSIIHFKDELKGILLKEQDITAIPILHHDVNSSLSFQDIEDMLEHIPSETNGAVDFKYMVALLKRKQRERMLTYSFGGVFLIFCAIITGLFVILYWKREVNFKRCWNVSVRESAITAGDIPMYASVESVSARVNVCVSMVKVLR